MRGTRQRHLRLESLEPRLPLAGLVTAALVDDDLIVTGDASYSILRFRSNTAGYSGAVAVDDSPTGVRAARAAGLACIGVPSDADHPLLEADHTVDSLAELVRQQRALARQLDVDAADGE